MTGKVVLFCLRSVSLSHKDLHSPARSKRRCDLTILDNFTPLKRKNIQVSPMFCSCIHPCTTYVSPINFLKFLQSGVSTASDHHRTISTSYPDSLEQASSRITEGPCLSAFKKSWKLLCSEELSIPGFSWEVVAFFHVVLWMLYIVLFYVLENFYCIKS